MRERDTHGGGTGVGMASVLMIVMVLAFTTFGILSLVSANADAELSMRAEEKNRAYYEAEEKLQEQLAQLDAQLAENPEEFQAGGFLELNVGVGEDQQLRAVVQLADEEGAGRYRLVSHELVSIGPWTPDNGLNVWDGGM